MQWIYEDKRKRIIRGKEEIKFSGFSSFYLIVITARVKDRKQVSTITNDHENLTVSIDNNKTFPKLSNNKNLFDSPAAFSGGKLHNLAKVIYLLTFLKGKDHTISLNTDRPENTATFESLEIFALDIETSLTLKQIENQAEDGDRRPWVTFVLDNLPLFSVTPTITCSHRKRDSDDVKIIIDDTIQGNILTTIKHFLWRFIGSKLPWSSPSKTETETFTLNSPQGLHYIEFWADRMPILHKINLDFGIKPSLPDRIPTVDNPKWTENFTDDPEVILLARLIFGEAENQPKEAKIGVGYTVLNRLKKQNFNWGYSIREIILKENQYDGLWNKVTYDKVRNPLNNASETRIKRWKESYEVAEGILSHSLTDPASGATNFHSFQNPAEFPSWATEQTFKIKIGAMYFYELEK